MKPSTHQKIKKFKKNATKVYYKVMYPLAWIIYKFEDLENSRIKRKATVEYVARLLAKDFYSYLCKYQSDNKSSVIIADWVDTDSYNNPKSAIEYFTTYKSKGRKYSRKLDLYKDSVALEVFDKLMVEFDGLNEYTYVKKVEEDMSHKWGLRGYKYTYQFGIKEN